MYYSEVLDLYKVVEEEGKYGDFVKTKRYWKKLDCCIVSAEVELKSDTAEERFLNLIASERLGRDVVFRYDGDQFRVINREKYKEKHIMLCKMIGEF